MGFWNFKNVLAKIQPHPKIYTSIYLDVLLTDNFVWLILRLLLEMALPIFYRQKKQNSAHFKP